VRLWEAGSGGNGVERGLLLLTVAHPDAPPETLASLSIGERDRRLLTLRQRLFGSLINSVAECPHCGAPLQFTVDARELLGPVTDASQDTSTRTFEVTEGDVRLSVRAPNSHDLECIAACDDIVVARRVLAERCIVGAWNAGEPIPPCDVADTAVTALAVALGAADPGADLVIDLHCDVCGRQWPLAFDVVFIVWKEIESMARRLLYEVHELAWAYGWGEAEILGLSDTRRRHYLALVR
jgi:hypothetical protein